MLYQKFETFSRVVAISTFVIATSLTLLLYFTNNISFVFIGFFFFCGALVVNIATGGYLLIKIFGKTKSRNCLRSLLLLLVNIPIGLLYFIIVVWVIDKTVIVLRNNSSKEVKNIVVYSKKHDYYSLKSLPAYSSKKVRFKLKHEGELLIRYNSGSNDEISGYVSGGLGDGVFTYEFINGGGRVFEGD
ncbi:hypothetical protein AAEX28_10440 [Lentisphaerota bacterium WC36G]|nr:hypothetical protein LJT99_13285 [Lentisphaerae bacterium WC36]